VDPTEGEQTNKQRRTLGWAWQTAVDLGRTLVLPELRLYDSRPERVGVNAAAQVIIPHHETFSTTIKPPYSSTKG
jgi:hypothetical protein